jgi:hypothetical protein
MDISDSRVKELEKLGWKFKLDPKQGWIIHDPVGEEFPDSYGQAWSHLIYAVEAAEEAEERTRR